MTTTGNSYKYKLDFYYQWALIYLGTLVVYGAVRGNFVEQKFEYVLNDPILYVIVFFTVMSIVLLALNALRNRALVVTDDAIVFTSRFDEHRVPVNELQWMTIGRERGVQTAGRSQAVVFRRKGKRRLYRVRVGRYEREQELLQDMKKIAARVPQTRRPQWRRAMFTDR
jgi:hypothetical protein